MPSMLSSGCHEAGTNIFKIGVLVWIGVVQTAVEAAVYLVRREVQVVAVAIDVDGSIHFMTNFGSLIWWSFGVIHSARTLQNLLGWVPTEGGVDMGGRVVVLV